MTSREKIISNYIAGYNECNIEKMTADFADGIVFENISGGKLTMSLSGLAAFKEQAIQAIQFFSVRKQTVRSYRHLTVETEVLIDYFAVLAIDFPNGLKKGDTLELQGRSIFAFSRNRIIRLADIS